MFVVVNRIRVVPGQEQDFEAAFGYTPEEWRELLDDQAPGFVSFELLRPASGHEYLVMSHWESREAYEAWTQSPAFQHAHRGGLSTAVAGQPVLELYETV